MQDTDILTLLWERSERAIEALTVRFGNRLRLTAMNILENVEDAEEAVNDTYLALWNAIPPERPEPLAGYVYRTGRNIALKKTPLSKCPETPGTVYSISGRTILHFAR